MKKILVSLAAVGLVATAAAPAAAQSWRDDGRYVSQVDYRDITLRPSYLYNLEDRVRLAAERRQISWGEARELRHELRQAQPLARRVEAGRARRWEVARLEQTINDVKRALANSDSRGRYDGRRHDWRR